MDGGILGVGWATIGIVAAIKLPFVVLMLWLCARIAAKAGYGAWSALWMLVPLGNVVAVWGFAFGRWPGVPAARPGAAPERARPIAPETDEDTGPATGREAGWVLSGFDGNGDRVRLALSDAELAEAGAEGLEVGRSRACRLTIEDDSVSRVHAALSADGEALCIVDLGSTNGTYVDGQAVAPRQPPLALPRGAQVALGDVRLSVNRG